MVARTRKVSDITVCTSWLHALGEVQKRVNEKNKDRGHF